MHHAFKLVDDIHNVALSRSAQAYRLHSDNGTHEINLETAPDGRTWLSLGEQQFEVTIATHGDDVFIHLGGETYELRYQHPLDRLAAEAGGAAEDRVLAPMPGSIISLAVKAGDAVSKGQKLLVMESMKMETTINASRDGIIAAVHFEVGQSFDRDAALLSLAPMEPSS